MLSRCIESSSSHLDGYIPIRENFSFSRAHDSFVFHVINETKSIKTKALCLFLINEITMYNCMKSLKTYIQEKLVIKKSKYNYFPQTKDELKEIIKQRIKDEGNEVDLNDIDVSKITDMEGLFLRTDFNGDISNWDVSNVTDMYGMFYDCKNFNQDISSWDVSNVTNMECMFFRCTSFNQDISAWDVSNVKFMSYMFYGCKVFNQDISNWDVSKVNRSTNMFNNSSIEDKNRPNFK